MYNQRLDDTQDYDWDQELVPQITETVGTGVAPDHSEDLDILASLEARIDDLVALRDSLLSTKGMSQQFALEAQRILPDFDGKRPIGYYSMTPSATRYAVALEEMSSGVWALIAAGITALIYSIVKFFKWLTGGKDGAGAKASMADRASQMREVQLLLAKCETLVKEGTTSMHGYIYVKGQPTKEVFSLDKVIETLFEGSPHDRRISEFLKTSDPFFHDLVNGGAYSQQMAETGKLFKDLQVVLRQRLSALEAVNKMDLTDESPTTRMGNMKALDALSEPTSVKFNGSNQTLAEVRSHISQLHHETASADVKGSVSFDQLFSVMSAAFAKSDITESLEELTTVLPLVEQMKDELQKLEKHAGSYSSDGRSEGHSTRIGSELRHAIFVLGQDVAGLSSITAELLGYQSRLLYMADNAASFATVVAARLGTHAVNGNGGELTTWQGVGRDLDTISEKLHGIAKS